MSAPSRPLRQGMAIPSFPPSLQAAAPLVAIYVYAFAVQQTVTAPLGGRTKWWMNVAVSLPVVVALSALSWNGVEKPALTLEDRPSALLQPLRSDSRGAL